MKIVFGVEGDRSRTLKEIRIAAIGLNNSGNGSSLGQIVVEVLNSFVDAIGDKDLARRIERKRAELVEQCS